MPEYIVFVMPPSGENAEPFDIPEWEFSAAMATANRYRARGWKACVVDYGMPFVSCRGVPHARTARRSVSSHARAMKPASEHVLSTKIVTVSREKIDYARDLIYTASAVK